MGKQHRREKNDVCFFFPHYFCCPSKKRDFFRRRRPVYNTTKKTTWLSMLLSCPYTSLYTLWPHCHTLPPTQWHPSRRRPPGGTFHGWGGEGAPENGPWRGYYKQHSCEVSGQTDQNSSRYGPLLVGNCIGISKEPKTCFA